jgi:hypothetical protein
MVILSLGAVVINFVQYQCFKWRFCHQCGSSYIGRVPLRTGEGTGWSKSLSPSDDYSSKNSVYSNNSHTVDDLKMAITEYIQNVDRAILHMVFENSSACQ